MNDVYSDMGLVIKTNKTEVMFQWFGVRTAVNPVIEIYDEKVWTVDYFTYLGSILSADCTADVEVNQRINKTSASFAQIGKRVVHNHDLKIDTKVAVYRAVCFSVLF